MKHLFISLLLVAAAAGTACAQGAKAPAPGTEARLIKLEKDSWEAWKRRDAAWFEANMAPDYPVPSGKTRAQAITQSVNGCNVTSFSFGEFKVNMLSEDVALVRYTATQKAVCDGKTLPAQVVGVSNYVRRDGKWMPFYHIETPKTN